MIADYRDQAEMELPRLMYSYELKRVRYLLQAYHRIRLQKIEKFILHILEKEDILSRLSEKEQAYAQVQTCKTTCHGVLLIPCLSLAATVISLHVPDFLKLHCQSHHSINK